MSTSGLLSVNPVLMDRVRLAIMAHLSAAREAVDFNTLIDQLDLTKGNLSTHLRKLEDAELIIVSKEFVGRKPRSTYKHSTKGKKEMHNYLNAVESLLKAVR